MIMTKTYDPSCYALAERFLADEPALNTEAARITLAAHIQESIEGEIQFMRRHLDQPALDDGSYTGDSRLGRRKHEVANG